jgi:HSP20 family molecular chaperone IbpA
MWDAWGDWMNRFMGPSFFERFLSTGAIAPVDVCERDNEYVVRMACAGCRPEDIDATVENDVVRIRGKFFEHEMASQQMGGQQMGGQPMSGQPMGSQPGAQPMGGQQPSGQWQGGQQPTGQWQGNQPAGQMGRPNEVCLICELPSGRFERDITLPTPVNAQQVRANFENGLLTLVLPKAPSAIGHKVQISQGAGTGMR